MWHKKYSFFSFCFCYSSEKGSTVTHHISILVLIKNVCLMDFHTYLSSTLHVIHFFLLTMTSDDDTRTNRHTLADRFIFHQNNQNNIPVGLVPFIIIYLWICLLIFCWWFCVLCNNTVEKKYTDMIMFWQCLIFSLFNHINFKRFSL